MRHKWIDKRKTYGSVRCTCQHCGMVKDARHASGFHWTEYRAYGSDEWITTDETPACEPVFAE